MTELSDSLVEKAAEALRDAGLTSGNDKYDALAARAVLDAVAPTIRADARASVLAELREFLPEWNYPPYVVAAICLEIKDREVAQ